MKEFKPPQQIETRGLPSVFLAGTIDMGNSENWQDIFVKEFANYKIDIYNPRRTHWDSSLQQDFSNSQFYQQVYWELNALEKADYIVLNLLNNSKSPISLLELGLFAKSRKLLVCCPDALYRSGNIQIVCDKFDIPLFRNIEDLKEHLKIKLRHAI